MKQRSNVERLEMIWSTEGPEKALQYYRTLDLSDEPVEKLPSWIRLESIILYGNCEFLEALKCLKKGIEAFPDELSLRSKFKEYKEAVLSLFCDWAKQGISATDFYKKVESFTYHAHTFTPEDLLKLFQSVRYTSRDTREEVRIFKNLALSGNVVFEDYVKINSVRLERILVGKGLKGAA